MPRKALFLTLALGMVAAACGTAPTEGDVTVLEAEFFPQVVDFLDDVGRSPSVALDGDGNPHLAYLGFVGEPAPGEVAAARPIGAPRLPGVLHAHLVGGVWTRDAVLEEADIDQSAEVAIALDDQGVHHVVWTAPSGIQYSTDAGGSFSQPQEVASARQASGLALALDQRGTPWVAWYEGATVRAARPAGERWTVEDVARVTVCADCPPVRAALAVGGDGEPLVAFTNGGAFGPLLARRRAGGWTLETIEEGGGGFAISLAVDGDGNPHVAYYTEDGEVRHAHSIGGGPWEVNTVGSFQAAPDQDTGGWSASIDLDDHGVHYVAWYDPEADLVRLSSNREGTFQEVDPIRGGEVDPLPGGEGGTSPDVAVSADGSLLYVAWYDRGNQDLQLGTFGGEEPLLAAPGAGVSPSPPPAQPPPAQPPPASPPAAQECPQGGIEIAAPPGAAASGFDKTELSAPAGEPVVVCMDNQDSGVSHNFAIYPEDPLVNPEALGQVLAATEIEVGPVFQTLDVPALDPGSYFYRCDVHPTTMTGTLTAEG